MGKTTSSTAPYTDWRTHLKTDRRVPSQSTATDTKMAGMPNHSGLGGLVDWGSNLQRIQALFGDEKDQKGGDSTTGISASEAQSKGERVPTTKPQGLKSPMLDQHEFGHWNDGSFCGLATMVMMMQANGLEGGTSISELDQYASKIYNKDAGGTSGTAMAQYLAGEGLADSSFTTQGTTTRLIRSLQAGQPVPFGVLHIKGEVTRLKGGSSQRYPNLKVGERHEHRFGESGHWVLVTRFEGKADNPTAYYLNDPDMGGELKCTPAELEAIGEGDGKYWMIEQKQ